MAYTVDWIAKEITIPTADLTLVSGTRYSLDMEAFRIEIRRLEAEMADGLWAPQILEHTNSKPDFAGANYVGFDELINGYTVQFSGVATRVDLLGSNNNIIDVLVVTGVSVVPSNSAGLQIVDGGSGVTEQDKTDIIEGTWDRALTGATHNIPTSAGRRLRQLGDVVGGEVSDLSPSTTVFDTDLTNATDDQYNDQVIRFITGNLAGQVRAILDYDGTNKTITVDEPFTEAPADTDQFDILPQHVHPLSQISATIWSDEGPY